MQYRSDPTPEWITSMLNTWLPVPDFKGSVHALRTEELHLQRLVIQDLLNLLHSIDRIERSGEKEELLRELDEHHPLYAMWYGHDAQLAELGMTTCDEYGARYGRPDPLYGYMQEQAVLSMHDDADVTKPRWFGDVDFHISHQHQLVRLSPEHYNAVFRVESVMPLVWPRSAYAPKA